MPEAYPFRLRVLRNLTDRLKEITPANGYNFDLSEAVFRGRAWYGEDDPLPLVGILEAPLPLEPLDSANDNPNNFGRWELLIQGFIDDDPLNPTDPAHILMADVKKKLAELRKEKKPGPKLPGNPYNILGMDGRVTAIGVGPGVVRPPDDISAKAYFWLTVTIELVENLEEPYS